MFTRTYAALVLSSLTVIGCGGSDPAIEASEAAIEAAAVACPTIERIGSAGDSSGPDEDELRGLLADWPGQVPTSLAQDAEIYTSFLGAFLLGDQPTIQVDDSELQAVGDRLEQYVLDNCGDFNPGALF